MDGFWKIPVSIKLRTPWLVPGYSPPGPETDIALAKNQTTYILPASFIKGVLRGALLELVAENSEVSAVCAAILKHGFGEKSGDGAPGGSWRVDNHPKRGYLNFASLELASSVPENGSQSRTQRVRIDRNLGAALDGHLLFIECPFSFGEVVEFKGHIISRFDNRSEIIKGLQLAANRIFALGGMKSVGFGRVESWHFAEPQKVKYASPSPQCARLKVSYKLDRPFIVDSQRHSGNQMVGSDVIPGGAIKGCISQSFAFLGRSKEVEKFLSQLNVSHAYPQSREQETPRRALPLSLSIASDRLFCNLDGNNHAGYHKFQPDWKETDFGRVRTRLAQNYTAWADVPAPEKNGVSRTAIDPETLGALYEGENDDTEGAGALFSQISIMPDKHLWVGSLSSAGYNELFGRLLGMLEVGIPGLGKTGAILTADWEVAQTASAPQRVLNLCLQSEACLLPPEILQTASLFDAYATYFKRLNLKMQSFSARQALRGGYQALRYPVTSGGYQPWLMTCAGSIFRLEVEDDKHVEDILTHGLYPWHGYSKNWQEFPFLRENGYGHVLNNSIDHAALSSGVLL